MGGLVLQLLRGASGALAAVALGKGVDVSTDGHGHELVTYFAWYGAAAVFVIAAVVLSIVIYKRHDAGGSPGAPDRCGDPKERLSELRLSAKWLAHDLKNFQNWWPAVEDEGFDDRIGGRPTTHKEAMQTLLYRFARFFSVAWAYERDCPNHPDWNEVIKEWVIGVYDALGEDPSPPPDYSLMAPQLQVIGERSTTEWGTAKARPIDFADFKVEIEGNPHFVEAFMQLKRLLLAADLDTKARARLEAVAKSAKHVEERLDKKGYRP
jgi:hypothetical protein